jgi:hypothetical protein
LQCLARRQPCSGDEHAEAEGYGLIDSLWRESVEHGRAAYRRCGSDAYQLIPRELRRATPPMGSRLTPTPPSDGTPIRSADGGHAFACWVPINNT